MTKRWEKEILLNGLIHFVLVVMCVNLGHKKAGFESRLFIVKEKDFLDNDSNYLSVFIDHFKSDALIFVFVVQLSGNGFYIFGFDVINAQNDISD